MEIMTNEEEFKKEFYEFYSQVKETLFKFQWDKEKLSKDNQELVDQTVRIEQRLTSLLNIYKQMMVDDRVFDEGYLEQYLGNRYSWNKKG